jgi:hypothetical protein
MSSSISIYRLLKGNLEISHIPHLFILANVALTSAGKHLCQHQPTFNPRLG